MLTIGRHTYELDASDHWTRLSADGKSRTQLSAREQDLIEEYRRITDGIEHFKFNREIWIQRHFLCDRRGFNIHWRSRWFNHLTRQWVLLPEGVGLQHADVCNALCFATFDDAYRAARAIPPIGAAVTA